MVERRGIRGLTRYIFYNVCDTSHAFSRITTIRKADPLVRVCDAREIVLMEMIVLLISDLEHRSGSSESRVYGIMHHKLISSFEALRKE